MNSGGRAVVMLLSLLAMLAAWLAPWEASQARQSVQEVRLGALFLPDSPADRAARLAIAEINAQGYTTPDNFLYQFRLVYPNPPALQPQDLPAALESLRQQQAHAILGPVSNDLAQANFELLVRAGVPVLTLATGDTLMDLDVTNNVLRLRAAESYYGAALLDYLLNTLGLTQIALVQTDVASTEALVSFELELLAQARQPAYKLQLPDNRELAAALEILLDVNPQAVVMWGPAEDASFLYRELQARGWGGRFAYRYAEEAAQRGALDIANPEGILGMNAWTYTLPDAGSRGFVLNYLGDYGRPPNDEAAAAYDAVYALAGHMRVVGIEMPALYETIINMPTVYAIQGPLAPQVYTNGDFSRNVVVYELNAYGVPQALARYENKQGQAIISSQGLAVAAIGTPTFTPSPTFLPTQTPLPSPTPSQAQLTALGELVVYAGAGAFFPELGVLSAGTSATIVGGNTDLSWYVVQYRGGIGWVFNDLAQISVFDPSNLLTQLPIIEPPPTPIGGASPTPEAEVADIVIDSVALIPPVPQPGQPFIANVTVRNAGVATAGRFTVAGAFDPGNVFSSNFVPELAPLAVMTVPLSVTLAGAGEFSVEIIADVNNDIPEGETVGEFNNAFRLSYRVDFPVIAQGVSLEVNAGNQIDLGGGTADLLWTGSVLSTLNGAELGIVTTATYEAANYATLTSGIINSTVLGDAQVFGGVLVAVKTAEGQYAILRIEGRAGTSLSLSYRLYGN